MKANPLVRFIVSAHDPGRIQIQAPHPVRERGGYIRTGLLPQVVVIEDKIPNRTPELVPTLKSIIR